MERLADFIDIYLFEPFAEHFSVQGRLYWGSLVFTLVVALLLYFFRDRRFRRHGFFAQCQAALAYCFPARIYRSRSTRADVRFFVVDVLLQVILVTPFLLSADHVAKYTEQLLVFVFGVYSQPFNPGPSAPVFVGVIAVVAFDLGFYIAHRLLHRVGVLWEFHKVHHSAEVLNPLTLYREHPVDKIVTAACVGLLSGLAFGVFDYFSSAIVQPGAAWVIGVLFLVAGGHFRHMEIWISYGPVLNRLLISPAHHQLHHSVAAAHLDRNFGGIFAVWDWMFGSLCVPQKRQHLALGLSDGTHKQYHSVLRLYLLPFARLLRKYKAIRRNP